MQWMDTEPRKLGATDPPALGERGRNCISAAGTSGNASGMLLAQPGLGGGTREEVVKPP